MGIAFAYTTPVAQASKVGAIVGAPITIDPNVLQAQVPYIEGTSPTAPIPGTGGSLTVTLLQTDVHAILATILARAAANAQLPPGSIVDT